jgi:hypothetical protein
MNEILKAAAAARQGPVRYKVSDAESQFYMSIRVFGIDSAETKAAQNYWDALKRQFRAGGSIPVCA